MMMQILFFNQNKGTTLLYIYYIALYLFLNENIYITSVLVDFLKLWLHYTDCEIQTTIIKIRFALYFTHFVTHTINEIFLFTTF